MFNLAGNPKATEILTEELKRCGIECFQQEVKGEVPSSVYGKLKGFTFRRAWYYYVVTGYVPEYVNNIMYSDYVGKKDIRSGGDCMCRNIWINYYKDKKQVVYLDPNELKYFRENRPEAFNDWILVDKPEDKSKVGKGYCDLYHIDSELGLYKFVQYINMLDIDGYLH